MAIHESKHPLVKHKIGLLREQSLSHAVFRQVVSELASLLIYEATIDLMLTERSVDTWNGMTTVDCIEGRNPTFVPILRAGLGMLDGALAVLPTAKISVVGLCRDEETLTPTQYYQKLTRNIDERTAIILDPMLATGGSVIATIEILKASGCPDIRGLFLLGAPEGIEEVNKQHPDVNFHIAQIDNKLNDKGYILPGLGDAGDRLFGTL